jgi:Secretion system C-terminal sorting domain
MKNITKSLYLITLLILFFSFILYAFSTGITGVTKKSQTPGCTCHGINPSTNVVVTIDGPDSLMPNQTANYSITISGGPLKAAGTNIAASKGSLTNVSNDLRIQNGELTHFLPKTPESGVVTFNFTYSAPSEPGEQTIYANGNSVNLNGQNTDDQWNFAADKIIQVGAITSINEKENIFTYKLEQNFPNPFNPSTKIRYYIPNRQFVSLKVYDLVGNEIVTLVNEETNAGSHEVIFNAKNIASGIYFYTLNTGNFSATKKFLLLK